jgi:hypothetical protein
MSMTYTSSPERQLYASVRTTDAQAALMEVHELVRLIAQGDLEPKLRPHQLIQLGRQAEAIIQDVLPRISEELDELLCKP